MAQGGNTSYHADVPAGSKPQTVIITTRDLKDGETTSAHMHFGVEMTQVNSGTFECYVKGQPVMTVKSAKASRSRARRRMLPAALAVKPVPVGDPGDRQGHAAPHPGKRCADPEIGFGTHCY
ncbi:MAG: hypothetical protein U1E93_07595 [Alphaproteobacteria bacterium]